MWKINGNQPFVDDFPGGSMGFPDVSLPSGNRMEYGDKSVATIGSECVMFMIVLIAATWLDQCGDTYMPTRWENLSIYIYYYDYFYYYYYYYHYYYTNTNTNNTNNTNNTTNNN